MKKINLVLVFLFMGTIITSAQTTEKHGVTWYINYSDAQKVAKKEGKPLLVFFTGSDWCGPCKLLVKDFFSTDKFKEISTDTFVMYEADFPINRDLITSDQKDINNALKSKFNVSSFPTVLLLNTRGKETGRERGFNFIHDTTNHYNLLEMAL
ncbi:MAG: thioredoxin family protein [Flavobacteriaceae bacterium]|nr:thioredoxin family protein [Flavobacteriaceae bacterium]